LCRNLNVTSVQFCCKLYFYKLLACRYRNIYNAIAENINYTTSRKVAGLKPDEANEFVSIYLIVPAALGPGVYSASNRNEYQKQKNNVSGEQSTAGA
jgi:hypothetical protein